MSDAAGFHDRNADDFIRQYAEDPDFEERLAVWESLIARFARPGMKALDLGCGDGTLSFKLAEKGAAVLGVDGAERMIERADAERRRRGLDTISFRQLQLPAEIPGAPFDFVIASSVLEYLDDAGSVDAWVSGLVKPGGVLALSLPNRASLYRRVETVRHKLTGKPVYRGLVKRLSTLEETIERFGRLEFNVVQARYFAHRPALSRWARGWLPRTCSENLFAAAFVKSAGD